MRRTLPVVAATALSLTLAAGAQAAEYGSRTLKVGAIWTAPASTRTSTASSGPARAEA